MNLLIIVQIWGYTRCIAGIAGKCQQCWCIYRELLMGEQEQVETHVSLPAQTHISCLHPN